MWATFDGTCAPGSTTSEIVNRRSRLAVSWALGVLVGAAGLAGSQNSAEPALLDTAGASFRTELPRAGSRIRIGIATDLTELRLPCCQEGLRLGLGPSRGVEVEGSVRVTPAVGGDSVFRLQAAALEDAAQADILARRLEHLTGVQASSSFDAVLGLFRVRLGRFSNREEAAAIKARFAQRGLGDAWIVREGRLSGTPALGVTMGSDSRIFRGRWLGIDRRGSESIRVAGHHYRGTMYVYLNDRGLLNLVDGGGHSCGEVRDMTLAHVDDIHEKITDLRRMESILKEMASKCDQGEIPECPILEALSA